MDNQGSHGQGQMAGGRMMLGNTQGNLPLQPAQGGILAPAQQHGQVPMSQPQLGHGGMGPQPPPPMQTHAVLPSPQPPGHGGVGSQDSPKQDNISKAKSLMPTIKDAVASVFRTGAEAIYANNLVDSGSKPVELDSSRFDKALEEFHSVCDHMEMHIKAAMECISQGEMSNENLSAPVTQAKLEGSLTYPQYVGVVQGQISYAKEVHDALAEAAQKLLE